MSEVAYCRADATNLKSHADEIVRIVGKLASRDGETSVIEASGTISARIPMTLAAEPGNIYEFMAKVRDDNAISVKSAFSIPEDQYDGELVHRVVALEEKLPGIFKKSA